MPADELPVIVGKAFTVKVEAILHPLLLVYVIMAIPADTAVTSH